MYGSMEAELDVQRTIKWAELTAFLSLLKKVIAPNKVHVDMKGIIDGLWKGERKCIDSESGDADLWKKDVGRIACVEIKRNFGGSGACQGAPNEVGHGEDVAF